MTCADANLGVTADYQSTYCQVFVISPFASDALRLGRSF